MVFLERVIFTCRDDNGVMPQSIEVFYRLDQLDHLRCMEHRVPLLS